MIEVVAHYTCSKVDIIAWSMGSAVTRKAILGGTCADTNETLGKPITAYVSFIHHNFFQNMPSRKTTTSFYRRERTFHASKYSFDVNEWIVEFRIFQRNRKYKVTGEEIFSIVDEPRYLDFDKIQQPRLCSDFLKPLTLVFLRLFDVAKMTRLLQHTGTAF